MTRPSLVSFGVGVIVYNLATSVLAWLGGWPPQLGGDPDPAQSYVSFLVNGSAISAPLVVLVVLALALVAVRRRDRWARPGALVAATVGVVFMFGAIAEFVAEHPHTPPAVVFGFGSFYLALALLLISLGFSAALRPDEAGGRARVAGAGP